MKRMLFLVNECFLHCCSRSIAGVSTGPCRCRAPAIRILHSDKLHFPSYSPRLQIRMKRKHAIKGMTIWVTMMSK